MPSVRVQDVVDELTRFAPLELAETWDNVGLLLGDAARPVERVMTCLTLTGDVAEEAAGEGAQLIVAHHPVLFRPVQRLTSETSEGRTLLKLLASETAVFSPHTAFDSALDGINAGLTRRLGLSDVRPLRPALTSGSDGSFPNAGGGRHGRLATALPWSEFLNHIRSSLGVPHLQFTRGQSSVIERVAVACGSAAEFIKDAHRAGCDALITGEARFHACLEARDLGVHLILAGHYATERPAVEDLARHIQETFPSLSAWPSRTERDPVEWDVG